MVKITVSGEEIAGFCRSMAVLVHGGIGLGESVSLLAEDAPDSLKPQLQSLGQKLEGGARMADALEESGLFPGHVTGMIRIGEETGRLEEALESLADFYEERHRTAARIRQALTYPAMLFVLMLAVITVLLVKVLPVFDGVYASLGSRLTGAAAGLLYLGQALGRILPGILAVLGLAAAAWIACRLRPGLRQKLLDGFRKRFGDRGFFRQFNNARFARAMAMGLRSGLPEAQALELAADLMADTSAARLRCTGCAASVAQGKALDEAMAEAGLLTAAQSRLLAVGMRSGSGDRVMENLADRLMEDANQALEDRVSALEPAMVLTASLLVGVILLAVMLPLMNIMSALG